MYTAIGAAARLVLLPLSPFLSAGGFSLKILTLSCVRGQNNMAVQHFEAAPFFFSDRVKLAFSDAPFGKVVGYSPSTNLVTVAWFYPGQDVKCSHDTDESPDDLELIARAPYTVEWKEYGSSKVLKGRYLAYSPHDASTVLASLMGKRMSLYTFVRAYRTAIYD